MAEGELSFSNDKNSIVFWVLFLIATAEALSFLYDFCRFCYAKYTGQAYQLMFIGLEKNSSDCTLLTCDGEPVEFGSAEGGCNLRFYSGFVFLHHEISGVVV